VLRGRSSTARRRHRGRDHRLAGYCDRPGHVPLFFADTEIVEFSPTDQLAETMDVVLRILEAAGA
jgi:hypothetical protein